MKKILFSILAGAMTLSASAQSSFTVTSNGKEYSFPITSSITVTDNELWKPEVVEVERQFKSDYKTMKADFQTSFSTGTQKSESGVTEYVDGHLIADHVWEIDFTTNDYKRVQLMVRATKEDTKEGEDIKILANKSNTQENLGACISGSFGDYFAIKNFGKDGKWAWIYNELTNTYIMVNRDVQNNEAYDFTSLNATVDKVATKDLNINNVTDYWKFLARVSDDNTAEKDSMIELKFRANPESNKNFTIDGIPYHVNTGKVSMKLEGIELNASFPDEWDIAMGKNFDFHFWRDALIDPEGFDYMVLSGTELPENMDFTKTSQDYPEFTIQDRNTLVSQNGMVICKFKKKADNTFNIYKKVVIPAGTAVRRSSTYPEPVIVEVHDTVYVEKHDTIYIKPLSVDELIAAGQYAEDAIGSTTSLYSFKSDKEFAEYATYYDQAQKIDASSIPSDKKMDWEEAVEQLKNVATAYGYYTKNMMKSASVGSYLMLGQGMINGGMAFNKRMDISESTLRNGYSMSGGSGYVAFARLDVDYDDTDVFAVPFNTNYSFGKAPCFGGAKKIDVYVLFSPLTGKYTPVYLAEQNGLVFEQWKGDTKTNYDTLDEAIQHFGKSTGNMIDRSWVKLDLDDEGARTVIANGVAEFPDLSSFTDFTVVTTCEDYMAANVGNPGVTVDTTTTPMTFSKDGVACEFSGVAVFTAKDSTGDKVALVVFKQGAKYFAYSYELKN